MNLWLPRTYPARVDAAGQIGNQSLRTGMLACYRFWEQGGNALHCDIDPNRANSHQGSSLSWGPGRTGPVAQYGSDRYDLLPSTLALNLPEFTIGLLLSVDATGVDHMAYTETLSSPNSSVLWARITTADKFNFGRLTNTNALSVTSATSVQANRFYWLFNVFYNGGTGVSATASMRQYVDGVLDGSSDVAILESRTGQNAVIGSYIVTGAQNINFAGRLGFVGVWNRALRESEIRAVSETDGGILFRKTGKLFALGATITDAAGGETSSGEASAATGAITLTGTVASHESGEASAASGKLTLTGSITSTSAGEKSAGTESQTFNGTNASHSSGEGSAASGAISFSAVITQASSGEHSAASGATTFSASVSSTESGEHSAGTGSVTISGVGASKSSGEGSSAQGSVGFSGSITQDSAGESSAAISILVGVITSTSAGATESALGAVVPPVVVIPSCGPMAAPGAGSACVIAAPGATSGCVIASAGVGASYVIPV